MTRSASGPRVSGPGWERAKKGSTLPAGSPLHWKPQDVGRHFLFSGQSASLEHWSGQLVCVSGHGGGSSGERGVATITNIASGFKMCLLRVPEVVGLGPTRGSQCLSLGVWSRAAIHRGQTCSAGLGAPSGPHRGFPSSLSKKTGKEGCGGAAHTRKSDKRGTGCEGVRLNV